MFEKADGAVRFVNQGVQEHQSREKTEALQNEKTRRKKKNQGWPVTGQL